MTAESILYIFKFPKVYILIVAFIDEYIPYRFDIDLSGKICQMLTRGRKKHKGFYVVKDTSNGINIEELNEVYEEIERVIKSEDCIPLKGTILKDKRDYKVNE